MLFEVRTGNIQANSTFSPGKRQEMLRVNSYAQNMNEFLIYSKHSLIKLEMFWTSLSLQHPTATLRVTVQKTDDNAVVVCLY